MAMTRLMPLLPLPPLSLPTSSTSSVIDLTADDESNDSAPLTAHQNGKEERALAPSRSERKEGGGGEGSDLRSVVLALSNWVEILGIGHLSWQGAVREGEGPGAHP